jgi:predicted CXXCH cytochrome family protein
VAICVNGISSEKKGGGKPMKKKVSIKFLVGLVVFSCSAMIAACANQGQHATETNEQPVVVKTAKAESKEQQTAEAPLYTESPRSLNPVECGACHFGQYKRLCNSNSKHRFKCTDCHEQLHAYVPSKNNYAEIMPKCSNCHDLPHGDDFAQCQQCHQDPHTPLEIPFSGVEQKVRNQQGKDVVACEVCHYDTEGKEFEAFPSKHNVEVGCTGCHAEKHGVFPTCFDCHEAHVEGQAYADCLVCHSPHSAKNIRKYPEETANNICGTCHTQIFDNLKTNRTKHSELQCATCHVAHGQVPQCQKCHGEPHGETVHKKFTNCLECHLDPHNLPVDPDA